MKYLDYVIYMAHSIKIVNQAKKLRRVGFSLGEIASEIHISKSTASNWTSKEKLTKLGIKRITKRQDEARKRAFSTMRKKRNIIKKKIWRKSKSTLKKIKLTTSLCRLLSSIFLWTEGEKGNFTRLGFTNSDPTMISTFLFLLRKSFLLDESKLRALVHIHEYHNEKEVILFWSKITKISPKQFTKSYLKPHTGKRTRENYMGSIHINYYDYKVARELASIYNMFAEKF